MALRKAQSLLEAMSANLFWGFGFTATVWALQGFGLFQILFLRMAIVAVCGLLWIFIRRPSLLKQLLPLTFFPSLFLVIEIGFQALGMLSTTASNAGFLTVTYIVFVPIMERIFWGRAIPSLHWLWVSLALVGTVFMAGLGSVTLNRGDGWILLSSLGASLHMLSIDRLGKTNSHLFLANTLQCFWGAVVLLPLFLVQDVPWTYPSELKPWLGLFSLTFGSTMLAFYFQMRAQRTLSPSVSSLLFLIESPIAAAFGLSLLGETLTGWQLLGCVLILVSAGGVVWTTQVAPQGSPSPSGSTLKDSV